MNKRVFICGLLNYPRGSAPANYVQYLGLALTRAGYEVEIISNINPDYEAKQNKIIMDNGIIVSEPCLYSHKRGFKHFLFWHILGRKGSMKRTLQMRNICKDDYVIVYSAMREVNEAVLELREQVHFKTIGCVAEWFQERDFGSQERWAEYQHYFEKCLPRYDLIFPISRSLEAHFKGLGCNTMLLPIMADTQEFDVVEKSHDKKIVVFPANGKMKDSLGNLLNSLVILPEELQKTMEFHIMGVNRKTIRKILGDNYDAIMRIVVLHDWMKYEDLIQLYQKAHFLFLPRPLNHMSKNNFPSKVPETMTYGVIPITSDVGDCTQLYLTNLVDSIFIEGDSVEKCSDALAFALRLEPEKLKEMGSAARRCVEEKLDYRVWYQKINRALLEL